MSWVLNTPKFTSQISEYSKIPNMAGLSKCERYTAFRIYQNMPRLSSEYISDSKFGRVLNMQELHRVLNTPHYR